MRFAAKEQTLAPPEALDALESALAAPAASALFAAAGELAPDRDEAMALTAALWRRLHDALLVREQHALPDERAAAARGLSRWSAAALLTALRASDEATEALRGNVAPSLAMEHLLLTLREAARA